MFTPHLGTCDKTIEHARKTILIPEESINNLSRDNVANMQTPGTPTSRLDKEMCKIINSTSIQDDREKYAMYQQALESFMYYKKMMIQKFQVSGVNTLGDINEVSKVNNDEDTNEENSKVDESIINYVPQKFQFKAKMLLQRLHDFDDVTWDNRGKITIDGSAAKGGNIVDFINDAVRNRKQPLSNGSSQFAQALRKANITREFIVNDKNWQLVSSPQSDSDNEEEETQQSDSEKTNEKPSNRSPPRKLRKRLRPEETPRYVTKVRRLPWDHLA